MLLAQYNLKEQRQYFSQNNRILKSRPINNIAEENINEEQARIKE
jgi:hypothetical protein